MKDDVAEFESLGLLPRLGDAYYGNLLACGSRAGGLLRSARQEPIYAVHFPVT